MNSGSVGSPKAEISFHPEFIEQLNCRRSEPSVMVVYESVNANASFLKLL